ncbi:hypothetical protein EZV62_010378 [Acer yangbiense]|uniref:Retrotransposon gag domain-containing protein n=1 Tax=Acer yangbiense TaxID=1000413 RepID=A0A5C7I2N1_9ROSI|nr:hypothetical protein EZV62_010378 [Acer yangbiense]
MCGFAGMGNLEDHLDTYLDWMNMQAASDAVKCRVFSLTLSGDARTWYDNLRRQNISSFNDLSKEFHNGFIVRRRRRRHMVHLNFIKKSDTNMRRFNEAVRQVYDFNEVGAVMAFIYGLQQERLSWSLSKRGPSIYWMLMEMVEKYATVEDINESKTPDAPLELAKPSGLLRRWFRGAKDKGKET